MYRKRFTGMHCSIARALEEVGEWWSLLIVRECAQGTTRFDEFQSHLGIARNVLTARFERLIELGIVERFPLEGRANTEGYRLTAKGEALFPVLIALKQWGDEWLDDESRQRLELVEKDTGLPVTRISVHTSDGQPLSLRDIRYVPGPGATDSTMELIQRRNARVLGDEPGSS